MTIGAHEIERCVRPDINLFHTAVLNALLKLTVELSEYRVPYSCPSTSVEIRLVQLGTSNYEIRLKREQRAIIDIIIFKVYRITETQIALSDPFGTELTRITVGDDLFERLCTAVLRPEIANVWQQVVGCKMSAFPG